LRRSCHKVEFWASANRSNLAPSVVRGRETSKGRSRLGDVHQDEGSPWVIEMFVDDVTGIGLWDVTCLGPDSELTEALDVDNLPMPDDLRQRIETWVDEYTHSIADPVERRRWTI
jgi:hypothetical protein